MNFKNLILIVFLFSKILLSENIWYVSPAGCYFWYVGLCLLPYPAVNDSDFTRDGAYVGLYANMDVSNQDVGKEFYFDVFNSFGISTYPDTERYKYKISLDSQSCCPQDTGCTSGFPEGYALFRYDPSDKKWRQQYCLDSSHIEIYDDYISEYEFGYFCYEFKVRIGHYSFKFYFNGEEKGSGSFWITPGWASSDKIVFSNYARGIRIYQDGAEFGHNINIVSTDPTGTFYVRERCEEWQGATASISNYKYYHTYFYDNKLYETGHHFHSSFNPEDISPNNPIAYDCPCSKGGYNPISGNLELQNDGYMAFRSTWNLPNTAGLYTFRAYLSKNFDGRIFASHKDMDRILGYTSLVPLNGVYGDGLFYHIDDCEAADKHCLSTSFYDRYVHYKSYYLILYIFETLEDSVQEGHPEREGCVPRITAASLKMGGCFDMDGNWQCPHHKHKIGLDVDIGTTMYNLNTGAICNFDFFERLQSIIADNLGDYGSFCVDEGNHYHCRFYYGWYNQ